MPDAYQQLGVGLYLRRAYEEAIENMQRAIELGNNAAINYYIIGRSYLNVEVPDCENAVPNLRKALEIDADMIPYVDAADSIRACGGEPPYRQISEVTAANPATCEAPCSLQGHRRIAPALRI